jgi:hypothetical protein
MHRFSLRPGSSQYLVIEFQQWHCNQVERCMRRVPRVKEECQLRLTALREQLMQIENDRMAEEEMKQKDLTNALFESGFIRIGEQCRDSACASGARSMDGNTTAYD